MLGFIDRMGARIRPAGLLEMLDDPRRQHRLAIAIIGATVANALIVIVPVAFVFSETAFGRLALVGAAGYLGALAVYTTGRLAVTVHVIIWSSLVFNVGGTVLAGGLVRAGGFMLWGVVNGVVAVLFLSKRWVVASAGSYVVATLALAIADPWLRAGRSDPDPWFSTLLLADVLLGSLLLVVPLTMRIVDQLQAEHEQARALMLNILPASVADRLKHDETVIDALPEVTTLFADIVGFTRASEALSPAEIVDALNRVFTSFDQIIARHGMEKIKTIGDGYHAVAGAPMQRPDHLTCAADAALEMLDVTAGLEYGGIPLSVRIGIDTGPVVAAVIGTSKFSYDLWGDSVNTASRMESHGEAGRIHVTKAVADGLSHTYALEPRGIIEVKSKGPMETFFLDGLL